MLYLKGICSIDEGINTIQNSFCAVCVKCYQEFKNQNTFFQIIIFTSVLYTEGFR